MSTQRLIVGISGSSGAILGIRLLQALQQTPIETHLIITPSARLTIEQETNWTVDSVSKLATVSYNPRDLAAPVASGSFNVMGMIVIPCSIKSLSAIANSYSGDLITRAADVNLKEGRPLLLVLREAPLHAGHIRLMQLAAESGAIIFPPVPAFYTHPQTVDEMVDNIVGRVLRRIGIENDLYKQWEGIRTESQGSKSLPSTEPVRHANDEESRQPNLPISSREDNGVFEEEEEEEPGVDELWKLPAMTLATVGESGEPHAATVYFAADERRQNLYFFSTEHSLHGLDLAANPRAAVTITPRVEGWQSIRGLQLRGEVQPVPSGNEWERAWACYLVKFPFARELQEEMARNTLYTFRPDWVRWMDNRRGFGHKEEWKPA
jgi:flavin prenyltransferase